jgi:predicted phage terminase large subunit-like protein
VTITSPPSTTADNDRPVTIDNAQDREGVARATADRFVARVRAASESKAPSLWEWKPNEGPQTDFLASSAYEVLYGGAAGGGKSESLLVAPLRWIGNPDFAALLMRRTFPELERTLIRRSREIYPKIDPGARYKEQTKTWTFSSGATIQFGHCEYEHSVDQYQGAEFCFIGFDEGTHFLESQYRYLLSRARSASGLPIRIRMGTNPGGPGHEWVKRRWSPWLDKEWCVTCRKSVRAEEHVLEKHERKRAEPGAILWYVNELDGSERWLSGEAEARSLLSAWDAATPAERENMPRPMQRQFIPARVKDNPHLTENDPGYADRLRGLNVVDRKRLLNGDWDAQESAGELFKRGWFRMVDAAPVNVMTRVRFWDRAATEMEPGKDPDWTVGVKMSRDAAGLFTIENVVRLRGRPAEVEATILNTAMIDGRACEIWISEDPGQAGKFEAAYYINKLAGFNVHARRETGDKVSRAKPVSAQAEPGNIQCVRAPWNEAFFDVLEAFPSTEAHDDDVDALSGAFLAITDGSMDEYINAVKRAAGLR